MISLPFYSLDTVDQIRWKRVRLLPDAKAFPIAFAFYHCSRSLLKAVRIWCFNALRTRSWVPEMVFLDSIRAADRADIQCLFCPTGEFGRMVSAAESIVVLRRPRSSSSVPLLV